MTACNCWTIYSELTTFSYRIRLYAHFSIPSAGFHFNRLNHLEIPSLSATRSDRLVRYALGVHAAIAELVMNQGMRLVLPG